MKRNSNNEYRIEGVVFSKNNSIETPIMDFIKVMSIEDQKKWVSKIETDILSQIYNLKINFTY